MGNLDTGYGVQATRRNGFCYDAAWEDESCSRVMCGWWKRREGALTMLIKEDYIVEISRGEQEG